MVEDGSIGCSGRLKVPGDHLDTKRMSNYANTNHTNDGDVGRNRCRCEGKNNGTKAAVGKDEGGRFMVGVELRKVKSSRSEGL
jgi:hypothetical protein